MLGAGQADIRPFRLAVARRVAMPAAALSAMANTDIAHRPRDSEMNATAQALTCAGGRFGDGLRFRGDRRDRLGIRRGFGILRQSVGDIVIIALGRHPDMLLQLESGRRVQAAQGHIEMRAVDLAPEQLRSAMAAEAALGEVLPEVRA